MALPDLTGVTPDPTAGGGGAEAAPDERSGRPSRRFLLVLVLICVLGAGIRIGYVAIAKQDATSCSIKLFLERIPADTTSSQLDGYDAPDNICGDAGYYHLGANLLADGKGYIVPFRYLYQDGVEYQAADHPPLYMTYLAAFSAVGARSVLAHQLASVALGIASVALIGLVGRRLAGERAGLIAAFLGAVYVYIWVNDGLVMSETLAITLTALLFLLTLRYEERPSWGRVIPLGVVLGLVALTRAELILYLPLVVPFVMWRSSGRSWRTTLLRSGAVVLVAGLVMAPWVVRNATTFERPVLVSSNLGITLVFANCDSTYYGVIRGYWDFRCVGDVDEGDQSLDEAVLRDRGLEYIKDNLSAVPRVVATRVLRQWNLYKPGQTVELDQLIEDREENLNRVALAQYYVLGALAVVGAVVLVRRRGWLGAWPLLSVFVIVTLTAAVTYGTTRFRTPAEVSIVLLAAIAIDTGAVALRRRLAGRPAAIEP
jgi:hypothetical protein